MSHIDEGELTAYADGAWAPAAPEAQRIAQHLAACENCRNRLAQAQELTQRAGEILAFASPVGISQPDFATLTDVASKRRRVIAVPLSWAASIVLAAGIGWFTHDLLDQTSSPAVATRESLAEPQADNARPAANPLEDGAATAAAPSASTAAATEPAAPAGQAGPAAPQIAARTRADARPDEAVAEPQDRTTVAREAPATVAAVPPAPAVPPGFAAAARNRETAESVETGVAGGRAQGARHAAKVQDADVADDARSKANYRVANVEVVAVREENGTQVVEHKLPDGTLFTLSVLPDVSAGSASNADATRGRESRAAVDSRPAARASRAEAPQPVRNRYIFERAGRRLVIAGNLSADSLRALAENVQ